MKTEYYFYEEVSIKSKDDGKFEAVRNTNINGNKKHFQGVFPTYTEAVNSVWNDTLLLEHK